MKFKYCPACGAVDMKRLPNGSDECPRCHFVGTAREGPLNEINAYRQDITAGRRQAAATGSMGSSAQPKQEMTSADMKNRLSSLKGKSTSDFEIF